MKRLLLRSCLLLVLCATVAVLGLACDSATPTAPAGTILTISASPSEISLTGTSTIVVIGRRPDGNPLNEGTEILFSTDLGAMNPTVVPVDEDGVARTTLRGDGRIGTATVTARLTTSGGGGEGGAGTGSASVEILIGRTAGAISLQASPSSVAETGETQVIELLAVVRDSQGQPLADTAVNFQTELGTLASGGSFKFTSSGGEVRDSLTVTPEQLGTVSVQSFQVSAEASGEGGQVIEDTFQIRIDRPLVADFRFVVSGLRVSFIDESTGNPTSRVWNFGDGTPTTTEENPVHDYAEAGDYLVSLTVRNARDSDVESKTVRVE